MVDETRNQMMQNLFGEQSEDEEEEEEEVDSEHAAAADADAAAADLSEYQSDEGEHEGENDDAEGEGEGEIEGQGEVEMESEAEAYDVDAEEVESEGERAHSSPERELSDQKMESQPKYVESEEEGYGQRVVTSRRREVVASESDESGNHYADHEGEEADSDQYRKLRIMDDQQDHEVVRDVFGDSDEEEPPEYGGHDEIEQDSLRSPMEETNYVRDARREDVVHDEDLQYQSEEDNFEEKPKDKPVGPPLDLEVPLQEPPGRPDKMNVIKVSNIMGIEPKPFDPKTYVEEDVFVTDESGAKKRIRLEDNIVRWKMIKNRDGTVSYESNARFVRWKDGSLQLLIGNEVLDISVHDAHQDQSHLFLRHGKGILQSQGRLLQKMKFMPSSLLSKSHRLLTALVDSRHKKVYKVKNCITEIDPEKEKEEKERVEGQTIRANEVLHRKREKVNRKYAQPVHKGRQLSPGFLEDAPDEEDDSDDYYNSRRPSARSRFEEDLEAEARAERRIISAKKSNVHSNFPRKAPTSSARPSRRSLEESESEREESEYESDGEEVDRSPAHAREDGAEHEDEYEEEADEEAADAISPSEDDEDEGPRGNKETGSNAQKRKEIDSDEESPPRKTMVHRRKAIVFDSDEE